MVEKGNRTDAQQGEVAALGRHGDPDAAVMKALLDEVERKLRWADKHFATLCSELVRAREENPYRITYEPEAHLPCGVPLIARAGFSVRLRLQDQTSHGYVTPNNS